MKIRINPAQVNGKVSAPASKSVAQRAIAIASLCGDHSEIRRIGSSQDVMAAISVCRQLGADITQNGDSLIIHGGIHPPSGPLYCGESGLGIRMFSGISATFDQEIVLNGGGSLQDRPMAMIQQSLEAFGVQCKTNAGRLPVRITGPIRPGSFHIDGSQGSQTLTGLLIASPLCGGEVNISVSDLKSKHYADITTDVMHSFGVDVEQKGYEEFRILEGAKYRAADYTVEGDWSGAAFVFVAAALAGKVLVGNLRNSSFQPDRHIIDAVTLAGGNISFSNGDLAIEKSSLIPFRFDATDCPDLFPPLVALAAHCNGVSLISGAGRLKGKESDRAEVLMEEFGKLGTEVEVEGDNMYIRGGQLKGGTVDSHGDHRIAMAAAITALCAREPVVITGAEAINKSYPGFFNDLAALTGEPINEL